MIQRKLDEFYKGIFNDKRIDTREGVLLSSMITNESTVINQCCSQHHQKIASYRMMNNKTCSEDGFSKVLYNACERKAEGGHLLCFRIQPKSTTFPTVTGLSRKTAI